jgi:3-hydroxyacyl-CoA dehydrogenase
VSAIIEKYRAQKGITPRTVSDEEIVERCIYALVNEGARIVEEGIAQRSSDVDMVYLNGYGFPAYRGGPMFYADQVGTDATSRARLRRIAASPGADSGILDAGTAAGTSRPGGQNLQRIQRILFVTEAVIVSTARTGLARAGRAPSI